MAPVRAGKRTSRSALITDPRTVAALNRERVRRGQLTLTSVARALIHERIAEIDAEARGSRIALDRAYAPRAADGPAAAQDQSSNNGACEAACQTPGATPTLARTGPTARPATLPDGRERAGGAKTRASKREAPG